SPTAQTILESEEGACRIYALMTDVDASEVDIGLAVELTFRKFHEFGGFHNYYWKCRPVRGEE
ncbi:MAG: hydroxymethylglutaryl-CoA synthase, partial [Dehalococcoidia bacterium]|nr:hydroxymethylglutaryl-CoA synthase [Dehalococcoidia bacterium]